MILETRTTVQWSKIYSSAHNVTKLILKMVKIHLMKAQWSPRTKILMPMSRLLLLIQAFQR